MLRQEIAADQLVHTNLNARLTKLQQQDEHLQVAHTHQENVYIDLLEKVSRWQSMVQSEKLAQKKTQEQLTQAMRLRNEEQIHCQRQAKIRDLVIPPALQGARQELKVYFKDPHHGRKYIQSLIEAVKQVHHEA